MPKQTRKQRLKIAVKPEAPPQVTVSAGGFMRQVLCPVCGRGSSSLPFWQRTVEFDPKKQFGFTQEIGRGRGKNFTVTERFGPEGEPEVFELVKARLLQAAREWRDKGWISQDEINTLLKLKKGGKRPSA